MNFNLTIDKTVQAQIDSRRCINCGKCGELCPTGAIAEYQKTVFSGFPYYQDAKRYAVESTCSTGCPLGIVPQAVAALVKAGDIESAYRMIAEKNPLPWVCSQVCDHFCQTVCKRELLDEPVRMQALERYILSRIEPKPVKYILNRYQKIAVIGGGPAGITAAHDLAKLGYSVTIFEKDSRLGGAMSWGIPQSRLDREKLAVEIERITSAGIEVRCNQHIGCEVPLSELWAEGFSAVLIAAGASYGRLLPIPGAEGTHVYDAVSVMRMINGMASETEPEVALGDHIVLVGGGDFALDLAEYLAGQGKQILCTTIESEENLQRSGEELQAAEERGIEFRVLTAPKQIIREKGAVKAVEFERVEYLEDERGVLRVHGIRGSEYNVLCDTVIFAVGQKSDISSIINAETWPDGCLRIDKHHRTNKAMIFACGDVTGESSSIAGAMAAGRQAAREIDRALQQRTLPQKKRQLRNAPDGETIYPENIPRIRPQRETARVDGMSAAAPKPVDDILPMLRSAGIEEKMPVLLNRHGGKKVAVAGGGIAGITAAISLAKKGYQPTIFEKTAGLGGSCRWLFSEKRIDRGRLIEELKKVEESGIEVVYNATVGVNPGFAQLKADGYEAILLAMGETAGRKPKIEHADSVGVWDVVTLMRALLHQEVPEGLCGKVLVLGNDEMALDAARVLREHCEEVTLMAECSRGGLQATTSAVNLALEEGVNLVTGVMLSRINQKDGRVDSIDCKILENNLSMNAACDTLVLCNTRRADTDTLAVRNPELTLNVTGYPLVNERLETKIPGVLSLGDYDMSGPDAGRAGAAAIDNYLAKGGMAISVLERKPKEKAVTHEILAGKSPQKQPVPEAGQAVYSRQQAETEASRCMACGYHKERFEQCMGCGICMQYCPTNAITMTGLEQQQEESWRELRRQAGNLFAGGTEDD